MFCYCRLLKALGALESACTNVVGGEPFRRNKALQPLLAKFPNVVTKEKLAQNRELSQYINKSSALAAIDCIVSLSNDVFVPSHGRNMGRAMQVRHRKYIKPNKRSMLPFFDDTSISDAKFRSNMRKLHKKSRGQPEMRANNVILYPIPECMCKHKTDIF